MTEFALKEWAVTLDALASGRQVLVVRKGGIGEKRFELPHGRFFLFPTFAHQRPELVKPEYHEAYRSSLEQREEPERLPLRLYSELHSAYEIRDDAGLAAVASEHVLTDDYAAERLKWRRKHPLWAVVLRVSRVLAPPVLTVGPEHGGCVSWLTLPEGIVPGACEPVLGDEEFARAEQRVADRLSGVAQAV